MGTVAFFLCKTLGEKICSWVNVPDCKSLPQNWNRLEGKMSLMCYTCDNLFSVAITYLLELNFRTAALEISLSFVILK